MCYHFIDLDSRKVRNDTDYDFMRRFTIIKAHAGCKGSHGYLMVVDYSTKGCSYDLVGPHPTFFYSSLTTSQKFVGMYLYTGAD